MILFCPLVLGAEPTEGPVAASSTPGDLQDIVNRGALRILYQLGQNTGDHPVSIHERELLEQFAREHRVSLEWIAVDNSWNLIPRLVAGEGDIIVGQGPALAAGMANQARFTSPWQAQHQQVVVRADTTRIRSLDDLGYRQVALKQSSLAWPVLKQLAEQYPAMDLVVIPEDLSYETILARVAKAQYDVTIVDSDYLNHYLPDHPRLSVAYDLGESTVKAWAVNISAVELQKTLEQFLFKHQLEWSIAKNTGNNARTERGKNAGSSPQPQGQLSPYDDLVRKYADKYGFDWRLIVAQMYQESQFKADAVSEAGAEGLMQMLPETASTIGADNLSDPEANIHAGLKYLNFLRNQFEPDLLMEERTWFSLASYNAGLGRITRARQLATKMGLDANRWFGNVETAMLALAQPVEKDGEVVRNCRCGQTVIYVKEIRRLYHDYVRLTRAGQLVKNEADNTTPYDI
ncbi:MAG: transglycosylase SLT domain-containing protein [Gammaproteobacteria bacterium]